MIRRFVSTADCWESRPEAGADAVNLIKNSIDAIDKEQARRRQIRASRKEAPAAAPEIRIVAREENERLEIELTDNGIGIEPHRMKEIFTAGHTTKGGASGLGLHSAANFVNEAGGRIWTKSGGIGTGTTVFVALPLAG